VAPFRLPTARRALLVLALAAIGIVLALGRCPERSERSAPLGPETPAAETERPSADLRLPLDDAESQSGRQASVDLAAERPAPAQAAPRPLEAAASIDRTAKGKLVVHVVDRYRTPIPQARVKANGWRTTKHPGDWYSWTGPEVDTLTNLEGIAVIEHRLWSAHSGDWYDVAVVCFAVEHPEYVSQDLEVKVSETPETTVILQRGAFLVVSGWIGSPAERIVEVEPHVSADVEVGAADWLPLSDGRPSCSRIPPGEHAIYLTYNRDGETWASEVVDFTLAEEEQKELHLELLAPRSLRGELDPDVPRPIVAGEVELNLYHGNRRTEAVFLRTFRAPIAADGSFRLMNLPPGGGEMIGLCEGWVSALVLRPKQETEELPPWEVPHEPEPGLQQVSLESSGSDAEPFVLRMERTARVEITVEDPAGEPLEGAIISMWPNVFWTIGWSGLFLDREWTALTDRRGIAVIENVPPGAREGLHVAHPGLRMPLQDSWGQARRQAQVDLAPGDAARITIRLEKDEE